MRQKTIPFQLLVVICLLVTLSCANRSISLNDTSTFVLPEAPANFFGKPGEYLDWQSKSILNITESILSEYPPRVDEPKDRQMAMVLLDAVFHDEGAPQRSSVQNFHLQRTLFVLEEIENTKVSTGVKIWKLYNMGVIIRTKTVTVAFDITRGYSSSSDSFALSKEVIDRLAIHCDALFISHFHRDHADEEVAGTFLEQGKPVITPPDIWKENEIYSRITHLERKAHEIQKIRLNNKDRDLEVVVYPGHQGADILNNVVLVVTPEQYSVCHTGDQSLEEDFSWIDEVGDHHKVDVLLPNCWTTNPLRTSKGYAPRLIIPAHENELGHTIDHREAYALNYSRWDVPFNKIIMTWGESFHYIP